MDREAIVRRLVFAKYLMGAAMREAEKPEPLAAVGLLLAHDSVELVLVLACEHLNAGVTRHTKFAEYFSLLETRAAGELEGRDSMLRLNEARVALKHRGTMPSHREVRSLITLSDAFIRSSADQLLGVSLEEVSLAQLVISEEARKCLLLADSALEENRISDALEAIAEAFARLLRAHRVGSQGHGHGLRFSLAGLGGLGFDREHEAAHQAIQQLADEVEHLRQEVALLRQGVDTRKLTIFRSLTPDAVFTVAGTVRFSGLAGRLGTTHQQASFCYDFVIESALRMQEIDEEILSFIDPRVPLSRFGLA